MNIKFFTNAAMEIIALPQVRILCDPWFTPGAFDGSWWQWPPLETRPEDLTEYTHLYVSHIHQDHCNVASLRRLPNKDIPVIILKKGDDQFLRRRIESCGFHRFIEVADRETIFLAGDVRLTMYEAFSASVFVENAEVPNIIDSSIVVASPSGVVFNANDNVPNTEVCKEIRETHGPIGIAMLPYSGVGPFPSSYLNLSEEEKQSETRKKEAMYLDRLIVNARVLAPEFIVPCAGQMILGGRQAHKNETLGVPDVAEAHNLLIKQGFSSRLLLEGDVLYYPLGEVVRAVRRDPPDREEYIRLIERCRYWWEEAFQVPPEEFVELLPLLQTARERMGRYQRRYDFSSKEKVGDWQVGITLEELPDSTYAFSLEECGKVEKVVTNDFLGRQEILQVVVPYNYLLAILTRHCHWNNAYHGCQVEWRRQPDRYIPEIQTLLSYLHL